MKKNLIVQHLGEIEYKDAWNYQENIFSEIVKQKSGRDNAQTNNYLLFCEHPHVYTIGKSGKDNNLLINDDFLNTIKASLYRTNRGGDITYHGPGQIVGYPIFNLDNFNLSIKKYIYLLEEVIINTLNSLDIKAERLEGATGVWLPEKNQSLYRKICAMGVRASRYVTMHGFALNVNTDLSYFQHINPCGFTDKSVTSIQKELKKDIDISYVKEIIIEQFRKLFNLNTISVK